MTTALANTSYVTVVVEPDPFRGAATQAQKYFVDRAQQSLTIYSEDVAGQKLLMSPASVSRPSGIQIKPNTYATAQVRRMRDGKAIPLVNDVAQNGGQKGPDAWTDWLLINVHEERSEKTQIVETFGDTYVYAFGEHPRVMSFIGVLLNTPDYPWRAVFWDNWENVFRATRLIEQDARMYIMFDDIMVEGYPLSATADQSAADPNALSFRFSFLVTNYVNLAQTNGYKESIYGSGKAYRDSLSQVPVGYGSAVAIGNDPNGDVKFTTQGASLQDGRMLLAYLGQQGVVELEQQVLDTIDNNPMLGVGAGYLRLIASSTANLMNSLEKALYDPASYSTAAGLSEAVKGAAFNYGVSVLASSSSYWRELGLSQVEKANGYKPGELQAAIGFSLEMGSLLVKQMTLAGGTIGGLAGNALVPALSSKGTLAQLGLAALGYGFWPAYSSTKQQQGGMAGTPTK